jgi:hypothetical protein
MTFTLQCPECGRALGYGWHSVDDKGVETTNVSFAAQSVPPVTEQNKSHHQELVEKTWLESQSS